MITTSEDLRDTEHLAEFILRFMEARLATLGEEGSGLYGYYKYYCDKRTGLAYYDPPIAKFLKDRVGRFTRVFDIGAGVGQLTALLAAQGYEAYAVDHNAGRIAAAQELFNQLTAADPRFKGKLHAISGSFPSAEIGEPGDRSIVLFTNVICNRGSSVEAAMIEGLAGFGGVLLDLVRFTRARSSVAQWEELAHRIMARGYDEPEEVFYSGAPDSGDPPTTNMWRLAFFPARSGPRPKAVRFSPNAAARPPAIREALADVPRDLGNADNLARFILAFVGERYDALGERGSGLYSHYKYLYDNGMAFAYYDRPAAAFLAARAGQFKRSVEAEGGIGQLSTLLAMYGYEARSLSRDAGRAEAAKALFEKLEATDRRFAGKLHAAHGAFPDGAGTAAEDTVAIFLGIVISDGDAVEAAFIEGMAGYGGVIIDLVRFTKARSSEAQWRTLAQRIMARGFGPPEEVFSHGEPDSGEPPTTKPYRLVYFPALAKASERKPAAPAVLKRPLSKVKARRSR